MEINPSSFEFLALSVDEASEQGHLPNPGLQLDLTEDLNAANTKAYLLALRSRLIDLGYLGDSKENRAVPKLDKKLKVAIYRFQVDAGLTADSWAGERTFRTLQQLVSFEVEQDPSDWTILKRASGIPAIARAVYLRLYALGFFDWKDRLHSRTIVSVRDNPAFKSALTEFLEIAWRLGLTDHIPRPQINVDTLRALFRQDELVRALDQHPEFVQDNGNERFIDAVARIELWLLGYDVNVGAPTHIYRTRRKPGRPGTALKRVKVTKIQEALESFWQQQPEAARPTTKTLRQTVGPRFFRELVSMEEEDHSPDEVAEDDLVRRVARFTYQEQDNLRSRLQDIAGSIWDGVKRVFRWIKRFIKSTVSTALNAIKNVARFIAKSARLVFKTVKKTVDILYRGAVYLRERVFPGSDPSHIVIHHDRDLDVRSFMHCDGHPEFIRTLIEEHVIESACFGAACRILSHLMAITRQVASYFTAAIGGWFLVLLTLTRMGRRLKAIADEVTQIELYDSRQPGGSPFATDVV